MREARPQGFGDRRRQERRRNGDRRQSRTYQCIAASWPDQRLQFITRYLFTFIGIVYFNWGFEYNSPWMTLGQMNGFFVGYLLWNTILFLHARHAPDSMHRVRIALWGDVVGISVVVLNDPWVVPLTSMVYIVIVLGNGMRYGMRCFTEAVGASFLFAMLTLTLRYYQSLEGVMPAILFMNLFGALILLYAYVLMARVERGRQALQDSSRRDPLTNLLNRSALEEEADRLLKAAREHDMPVVVMFADLDRFKSINDEHGHAEGDEVLRSIARILTRSVRDTDLAARYGGDEFVLILQDIELDQAMRISERIQKRLERWVRQRHYDVGISIGLGEAPRHGSTLQELLDQVDAALYECKGRRDLSVVALA